MPVTSSMMQGNCSAISMRCMRLATCAATAQLAQTFMCSMCAGTAHAGEAVLRMVEACLCPPP